MLLRMLKRDLRRKKTMNTVLFLFIILSSMFMASGISNTVTVLNGLDGYLEAAGVGDYNILTMGRHAVGALDEMLENEKAVNSYRIEDVSAILDRFPLHLLFGGITRQELLETLFP